MDYTNKTTVLLVNLGTPEYPKEKAVQRYLTEFLLDPRVIDIPAFKRHLLVRGIIIPRRKKAVTKSYQEIWSEQGSPLLVYTKNIQSSLQQELGDEYRVHLAMRYQFPSLESVLETIYSENPKHLIILPLFPQYASATTGSILQDIMEKISSWKIFPKITCINEFATFSPYIEALAATLKKHNAHQYDKVVFSFHGLPKRQLKEQDKLQCCFTKNCCEKRTQPESCYAASCHATAVLTAKAANIQSWTIAFQSRLGKEEWLTPYLIEEIKKIAPINKKILVISPSFVADCLETVYELGKEVKQEFIASGGVQFDIVPCLNENAARPLAHLIRSI